MKSYQSPLSCQILGAVVDALNIRDDVLTGRTAKRFYKGKVVSEQSKADIYEAFGRVLVESCFVPVPDTFAQHGIDLAEKIGMVFAWHAAEWDRLCAYAHERSVQVRRTDLVARAYVRLAAIDFSLRVFALLRAAKLPSPGVDTPVWAFADARKRILRDLLKRCEPRVTAEYLAHEVGVSDNSVDAWLYQGVRPSDPHIEAISKVLADRIAGMDIGDIKGTLTRQYTLAAACELLAENIGRDAVVDSATAACRYVTWTAEIAEMEDRPPADENAGAEYWTFLRGVRFPTTENLVKSLWQREEDDEWKTDLLNACIDWSVRVQEVALCADGEEGVSTAGLAERTPHSAGHYRPSSITSSLGPLPSGDPLSGLRELYDHVDQLRRRVKNNQMNAELHMQFGSLLGWFGWRFDQKALLEEGILECRIASELMPDWDPPAVEVGIILINAGRYQEAVRELELVEKKLGRMTPHLALNFGASRMMCDNPAGALPLFEYVIEEAPDNARALDYAGQCAFLIGDSNKGIRLAKLADRYGASRTYGRWRRGEYRGNSKLRPGPEL